MTDSRHPRLRSVKEPRPTPVTPKEDITGEVLSAIKELRDGQTRIADVLAEILRRLTSLETK